MKIFRVFVRMHPVGPFIEYARVHVRLEYGKAQLPNQGFYIALQLSGLTSRDFSVIKAGSAPVQIMLPELIYPGKSENRNRHRHSPGRRTKFKQAVFSLPSRKRRNDAAAKS